MTTAEPNPAGSHATEPHETEPIGYAEALAELEAILGELEGTDVDVDRLADRVARAAQLIAFCRDRIGGARLQIDEVLAGLDGASASGDATAPEPT